MGLSKNIEGISCCSHFRSVRGLPNGCVGFGVIAALTGLDRLPTLDYTSHCAGPVRLVA